MNNERMRGLFPAFFSGILNSYTQVFFSNHRVFAWILVLITFFDFWAGASGMIAVAVTNTAAYLTGLNSDHIRKGYYGFNSLLVGLGLGIYYHPGAEFFLVLISASILTLLLTLMAEGITGKYGLPFLSLSFLLSLWLVTLASRQFTMLNVSERGIYMINEMFSLGGERMVETYNWFTNLSFPDPLRLYFKSLGAVFFQYHLLPGILIALGLLIYSRIAFILSLLGFFSAYVYYAIIGADIHELSYSYIGFNFILSAIAIGGFFVIPSWWSFLWVILLTPVISIILTSTQTVFSLFQLSVYSLPFNLVVLLFLYALKFRERFHNKPQLVGYQQYSPEKNLYSHANYQSRFGKSFFTPLILPFWGEWKVTQGHNGAFTHQGEWRHAWDFEVADEEGLTFSGDGSTPEDYYAYNKPVIAPADGTVELLEDGLDDNMIGRMDLEHNWGNTLILKHGDHLFTKLSHLKKGSFKVAAGDTVKKGQVVAACGNSGRSPVPHIHFQVQSTPYVGSRTLDYPVSHYIRHQGDHFELRSYETPEHERVVSNITRNNSLEKAFHFIPGQLFRCEVISGEAEPYSLEWEVQADALNLTYIWCKKSGSKAWFRNDGDIHWFTFFEGDRSSLLFRFYLSAYKVMMGYYANLLVRDQYPVNTFNNRVTGILQDFIAPFVLITHTEYSLRYLGMDDTLLQTNIRLRSAVSASIGKYEVKSMACDLFVGRDGLEQFTFHEGGQQTVVKLIRET